MLCLEVPHELIDQTLVEDVAAEERIAVGGQHFDQVRADLDDRDVEGPAAEVVHRDDLRLVGCGRGGVIAVPVGQSSGRRLVDDPFDVQARDLAGIFRGGPLAVVKVRRNSDHGPGDLVIEVRLCVRLQPSEDHRRDLGRRVLAACHFDPRGVVVGGNKGVRQLFTELDDLRIAIALAHQVFHAVDRVVGIENRLIPRLNADQALVAWAYRDDRWCCALPFGIDDDRRDAAFHDRDA